MAYESDASISCQIGAFRILKRTHDFCARRGARTRSQASAQVANLFHSWARSLHGKHAADPALPGRSAIRHPDRPSSPAIALASSLYGGYVDAHRRLPRSSATGVRLRLRIEPCKTMGAHRLGRDSARFRLPEDAGTIDPRLGVRSWCTRKTPNRESEVGVWEWHPFRRLEPATLRTRVSGPAAVEWWLRCDMRARLGRVLVVVVF